MYEVHANVDFETFRKVKGLFGNLGIIKYKNGSLIASMNNGYVYDLVNYLKYNGVNKVIVKYI